MGQGLGFRAVIDLRPGVVAIDDLHAYAWWAGGMITFALIIVVVVAIVMAISNTALGIDTMADEIITAVRRIKANTDPLFALSSTQGLAGSIAATVGEIETDCEAIAGMAGQDVTGPSNETSRKRR